MGEIISFGDSLVITGFSMGVVFVGLIVLSGCISILKGIGSEKKPKAVEDKFVVEEKKPAAAESVEGSTTNDEELVAVIAAAIAASLGVGAPQVNIKSIRRVPQHTPRWTSVGRQEQMYGKL